MKPRLLGEKMGRGKKKTLRPAEPIHYKIPPEPTAGRVTLLPNLLEIDPSMGLNGHHDF